MRQTHTCKIVKQNSPNPPTALTIKTDLLVVIKEPHQLFNKRVSSANACVSDREWTRDRVTEWERRKAICTSPPTALPAL